jgi:hypothetical protein
MHCVAVHERQANEGPNHQEQPLFFRTQNDDHPEVQPSAASKSEAARRAYIPQNLEKVLEEMRPRIFL